MNAAETDLQKFASEARKLGELPLPIWGEGADRVRCHVKPRQMIPAIVKLL
jgi:hypothetical protein